MRIDGNKTVERYNSEATKPCDGKVYTARTSPGRWRELTGCSCSLHARPPRFSFTGEDSEDRKRQRAGGRKAQEKVPGRRGMSAQRDKTNKRTRELFTDKAVRRRYGLCVHGRAIADRSGVPLESIGGRISSRLYVSFPLFCAITRHGGNSRGRIISARASYASAIYF
ncbi:hypothetical protein PUN28_000632 [Cardiocondyla obscurior]|uniref:Uncharacterized protein n=1 Tax=Cardiocondyla obscurior TaxID=286306 RepID=A0AAW2H0C7_9HYME